jgi:hypothetical protein
MKIFKKIHRPEHEALGGCAVLRRDGRIAATGRPAGGRTCKGDASSRLTPPISGHYATRQVIMTMHVSPRDTADTRYPINFLTTARSLSWSKGFTIQPVAPAAFPSSIFELCDSVVSTTMGVNL